MLLEAKEGTKKYQQRVELIEGLGKQVWIDRNSF